MATMVDTAARLRAAMGMISRPQEIIPCGHCWMPLLQRRSNDSGRW
nr:MAG TPA: hypothetical protein [Caudoviricetes sp.]